MMEMITSIRQLFKYMVCLYIVKCFKILEQLLLITMKPTPFFPNHHLAHKMLPVYLSGAVCL